MSLELALNYLQQAGDLSRSDAVEAHMLKIAANPGKAGEAYLMQAMNDLDTGVSALFKACIILAMSPFVTFGVGAQTVPQPHEVPKMTNTFSWDQDVVRLLTGLATRQITGHAAQNDMNYVMSRLSDASRSLLYRVLVKELRIGVGAKTVNKHHKGLVIEWEMAGAKRTKEALHKVKWGCWAEYKLDGWRCLVRSNGNSLTEPDTFSRNALPMENLVPRAKDLHALTGYLISEGVLEDIVWAWDGEGKKMGEHFNSTSSEASKKGKGADLTYNIFDILPWSEVSGGTEPIEKRFLRRDAVQRWLNANPTLFPMLRCVERFELDCEADAWELYAEARELGHEGLILKQKGSTYQPGKTEGWVKVKPEETLDLLVVGVYEGKPGTKYEGKAGGIIVRYLGVDTEVGSGLSDEQRGLWLKNPELVVNSVAEILFHEITPAGKLREPRLKKVRTDKGPDQADGLEEN